MSGETSSGKGRKPRGPAVFMLDASGPERPAPAPRVLAPEVTIADEEDFVARESAESRAAAEPMPAPAGGAWLATLFWSAVGLIVSLVLYDQAASLVASLTGRNPWLGAAALGLIGVVVLILLIWLAREIAATLRMRRVERLRETLDLARASGDPAQARAAVNQLLDFYAKDATSAAARAGIARSESDILDAETLVDEAERGLMTGKDAAARAEIAAAAQRVSLFTALSPRALVDILFVLAQSIRLIRRLSEIYGGRASGLGLWRLSLRIGGHIAITGGLGVADQLAGQLVGAGLAARLSAKLGEGVVNGVLTARIGIAAAGLCRPMHFRARPSIILSEVVKISVIP